MMDPLLERTQLITDKVIEMKVKEEQNKEYALQETWFNPYPRTHKLYKLDIYTGEVTEAVLSHSIVSVQEEVVISPFLPTVKRKMVRSNVHYKPGEKFFIALNLKTAKKKAFQYTETVRRLAIIELIAEGKIDLIPVGDDK